MSEPVFLPWRSRRLATAAALLLLGTASAWLVARPCQLEAQSPAARFGTPVAIANDRGPPESAGPLREPERAFDAAIPPPLAERLIDLETALTLAGAENPTIALAREAVQASLVEQLRARALLLPTLVAGMDYNLHRGNLQATAGNIVNVDRQSLYAGAGAAAVGAGTVGVPGVRLTAHLTDAWFEPRAARQVVVGRQLDALAARNTVLLDVTSRFFALAGAEATLQAARQSEKEAAEVARITADFARTGQGRQGDADRASTQALLLGSAVQGAQGEVAVAGAELARLLSADPAIRLRVAEGPVPLVQLMDPRADLESLEQIAMRNRPEIGARGADVAVAETRLRKERARPWLPFLTIGFSAGEFGGGSNMADTSFGHFNGRTDFDAFAVWSLQNLGLGNLAIQRQLRAQVGAAGAERVRIIAQVRREVADAHALSAARLREVDVARHEVDRAERAFQEDFLRTRNLVGYPIETLRSLTLLVTARQALIAALVGYDQAQFQLFVALGQPPPGS